MASTPSKRRKVTGGDGGASSAASTPRKTPQKRPQYSQQKMADAMGFPDLRAFQEWMKSNLFQRRWALFEIHGMPKKGKGKKGWEFNSVYSHMTQGERNGICKYSDRDSSPEHFTEYIDCLAWLLLVLTTENTKNRMGALYQTKLQEIQRYHCIWDVICYKIWSLSPSRVLASGKSHSRNASSSSAISNRSGAAEVDNDEEPLLLDPEKGILRIRWASVPDEVEDEGDVSTTLIVKRVCSYGTQADLYDHLRDKFCLGDIAHEIASLTVDDLGPYEWTELLRHCHESSTRVNADLETVEIKGVPQAVFTPLPHESDQAQLNRKLLWQEVLQELKAAGAEEMDLSIRYWKFQLMRAVASGRWWVELDTIKLKLQSNPVDPTEHIDMIGLQYAATLDDVRRHLESVPSGDDDHSDGNTSDASEADAPPETKLHEITPAEIAAYKEEVSWLLNPDYERDNHEEACEKLNIRNPQKPHIPGMLPAAKLHHFQPTGIRALVQFEDSDIGGGILSDEVGLGKTYQTTAYMLAQDNARGARISVGMAVGPPKVTVLLVPKGLIKSWKEKILDFTDRFQLVIYYGTPKKRAEHNVVYSGPLTRSNPLFDQHNEENARTIILSTVATFGTRHGPTRQWEWKIDQYANENGVRRSEARQILMEEWENGTPHDQSDEKWPGNLGGLVGRLVVDEGHELRHQSEEYGTAIDWIRADKRMLITATPSRKGIQEFAGVLHYVQNPKLNQVSFLKELGFTDAQCSGSAPLKSVLEFFDPWSVATGDPKSQLRYTDIALRKYIFSKTDRVEIGVCMREILKKVLLKRSYASTVSGKRIGESLPEVQRTTISCTFTKHERLIYDNIYDEATMKLCFIDADDVDASVRWSPSAYRQLCMVTCWLPFQYLHKYKVKELKQFRKSEKSAWHILEDIQKTLICENLDDEMVLPNVDDAQDILTHLARGSPKLRMLLHLLSDIVVLCGEKVIIWVQFPAQMEWLKCALALVGLDARCLYADLSQGAREKLTDNFHKDPDGFKILIASYMVSATGLDLHGYCRTVIEFEPAPDEAMRVQVVGRVLRLGQDRWIRHIILVVEDSFDTKRIATALLQDLPGLMAHLNMEVWGKDGEQTSLGDWVLHEGVLRRSDDSRIEGLGLDVLDSEQLLLHIRQRLSGQDVGGDLDTTIEVSNSRGAKDRAW